MIRKFEKNDIKNVMKIWKDENIKAHQFIQKNIGYLYKNLSTNLTR